MMPITPGSLLNTALIALPIPTLRILQDYIAPEDWHNFLLRLASVVPSYVEGQFTGVLTGCTTAPSATFKYIQIFNFVLVSLAGNLTALSNSTACTVTGLSSAIIPQVTQIHAASIVSSGTEQQGKVVVGTNGVITLQLGNGSATFVNDGLSKGLQACNFCYSLSA